MLLEHKGQGKKDSTSKMFKMLRSGTLRAKAGSSVPTVQSRARGFPHSTSKRVDAPRALRVMTHAAD